MKRGNTERPPRSDTRPARPLWPLVCSPALEFLSRATKQEKKRYPNCKGRGDVTSVHTYDENPEDPTKKPLELTNSGNGLTHKNQSCQGAERSAGWKLQHVAEGNCKRPGETERCPDCVDWKASQSYDTPAAIYGAGVTPAAARWPNTPGHLCAIANSEISQQFRKRTTKLKDPHFLISKLTGKGQSSKLCSWQ